MAGRTENYTPKGSKHQYSSYVVGIWTPKVNTILLLGPFVTDT